MFDIAKSPSEFLAANPDLPADVKELVRSRPDLLMISKTRGNSVNFTGEDGAQDGELHR